MGKKKMYKKNANGCTGDRTTLDEASKIHKELFKFSSRAFHWEPLFEQEHSQEELQEMLDTKPHEYVRCKLKMERHDLAYAKPLNDPTSTICISGRDAVGRSFPGDEVCVQILSRTCQPNQGESVKGKVVGLLDRSEKSCTIICRMEGHKQLATPVKKNMTRICILKKQLDKIEIRNINPNDGHYVSERSIDMAEDQLLVVKVLKWEKTHQYPLGAVTNVISQKEYYNVLLELEYGIKDTPPPFQPKCDQEENEERNLTFTIDSSDAQDLDDAFSLSDHGEQYMIAIHITDVASYIRKGSKEDTFAKKQGRTFYPPPDMPGTPALMLSREASNEFLSLLPGQKRKTISLKIMINKTTNMIESSDFTRSVIKSDRRLSYNEADKIIQECCPDDNQAPLRFSSVEDCVAVAYCFTKVLRNFRLEGSWSSGQRKGDSRAHCMVEELMIFYNNAVAEKLISKDLTRDLTPLRCQFKPDPELLESFKRKYSPLLPLSPYLSQICEVPEAEFEEAKELFIHVLRPVFEHMETLAQKRDYHQLVHLIIKDEIHPTLCHMAKEFKQIQNKAVILRSCSNLSSRLGHYDLQLNTYTWASSPMRRYLDLVLQRLLHSVLSDKNQVDLDYTKKEIDHFCDKCDSTEDFDLESLRFINATKSSSRDLTKLAVVDKLSEHEFMISIPLDILSGLKIKYRNLKVVEQPAFNLKAQSCTLTWKRRVYSFLESKPQLQPKVSENKNVILISVKNWLKIISTVKGEDWGKVSECLRDVKEAENNIKCEIMPKDSLNKKKHFKEWKMELKSKNVLQVQLGTEVVNGATLPAVNLLTVSSSFEVCLEHARNPIKCFTPIDGTVCHPSKTKYEDYKEYQEIWGKLCQMDTAYNAVEENNSVILEDVSIKWTGTTETSLEGYFKMTQQQTKDWSLEFDLTNCYLCVRLRDQYAKKEEKTEATQCNDFSLSDLQNTMSFTWVAHGITIKPQAQKQGNKKTDKKLSHIQIHFQINPRNMLNIPCTLQKKDTKFTVEVIPKKIPYVQYEHAVENIKKANKLVKSIAMGTVFNAYNIPKEPEPVYVNMDHNLDLPPLNESQKRAVEKALKNPFTVIQGPPGTGKTVVGVHITYQFYKKNKRHEAQAPNKSTKLGQDASLDKKIPKRRGILYCGPSNKSVDIVAEQLLKLKGILKPLRIYCDQMEMREYPYPGSDLKLCLRSLRDEKPKEALRDISLMDLVRQPDNPHSAEIKKLENGMQEFNIESYKKVLKEARKHELLKHDVILCTCSTALKPILMETMDFRQILIDECAMATEPEAFIPLVSHKPEQIVLLGDHKQIRPIVTCARVKELGMEKSLFERYMDRALMLDTQYRMHERICEFPSKEFYYGKLRTGTKQRTCLLLDRNDTPTAILFGHVEGQEISLVVSTAAGNERSAANEQEAKQAVRVANLLVRQSRVKPEDIAILTPYNAQMCKIKEMLGQKENQAVQKVNVCTIMKSQGSEWRYVILSTVRSCPLSEIEKESYISKGWLGKKLGFITDPNQVNVAITRAQDGLCILGNCDLLNCSELWRKLLSHYQRRACVLDSAEDIKVRRLPVVSSCTAGQKLSSRFK